MSLAFLEALEASNVYKVYEGPSLPAFVNDVLYNICSKAVMKVCIEMKNRIRRAVVDGEKVKEFGNMTCIPAFTDAGGITRALGVHAVEEFWPNENGDGGGNAGEILHAEIIAASVQAGADLCIERIVDTKEYNPKFFETYVRVLAKRIAVMAALPVSPADPAVLVCFFLREYLLGYAASKSGFTGAHEEKLRGIITEELDKFPALLVCAMPKTGP